jgi:serine/threonine-protein kinase HipA
MDKRYCMIRYVELTDNENNYSLAALKALNRHLTTLQPLTLSAQAQRQEAMNRAAKLSIQGVQAKISATLNTKSQTFDLVDTKGTYIIKPPSDTWPELPPNEGISMHLAGLFSIQTPLSGLISNNDGEYSYFIKRFDRGARGQKMALEDFAQLSQKTRETKYDSSIEQVIKIINQYASFPMIERVQLLKRILFSYLIGNEDMHLKNYSLININQRIGLSPAYDLLNTTIALRNPVEQSALPLNGKKNKLSSDDFFIYLAKERLNLSDKVILNIQEDIKTLKKYVDDYIPRSFLSAMMKQKYQNLFNERYESFKLITSSKNFS